MFRIGGRVTPKEGEPPVESKHSAPVPRGMGRSPRRRVRRMTCAVAAMSLTLGLAGVSQSAHSDDPVLDQYGQKTSVNWPGKVTSDAQLRGDVAADQAYYGSLRPPNRDLYGGDNDTQHTMKLSKTGYFHVETVKGRSVLVDPRGNQFFSLGVNSFGSVGDTYTQVTGRENQFAWLPGKDDTGPFADGWRASDKADYSFYLSNLVRKYGQSFDEKAWYAQQVSRVTKWGFNTAGGFSNLVAGGPRSPTSRTWTTRRATESAAAASRTSTTTATPASWTPRWPPRSSSTRMIRT